MLKTTSMSILRMTGAVIFFSTAVSGALSSVAAFAKYPCDLPEWRDLSHESKVLKSHSDVAERLGNRLVVHLENGKNVEIVDKHEGEEAGSAFEIHRVIAIGPKNEWVVVFEPATDSFGYRIIHRKTGSIDELGGCPIWSKDGKAFVALHEDLESGRTANEASLWTCQDPSDSCKKSWGAPDPKLGGRDAHWSGQRVAITLAFIDNNRANQPTVLKTVHCRVKNSEASCK